MTKNFFFVVIVVLPEIFLVTASHANKMKPRSPIVDIPRWGKIQGFQDKLEKKIVSVYLGIPYAHPPTGRLRFEGKSRNNNTNSCILPQCKVSLLSM